jgi:hypothetical protein
MTDHSMNIEPSLFPLLGTQSSKILLRNDSVSMGHGGSLAQSKSAGEEILHLPKYSSRAAVIKN